MQPPRLQPGDEIRVIAPSMSMAIVKGKQIELAKERLEGLGFHVTFGRYVDEHDLVFSTSVENRLADLHEAFGDPNVKAIFTAIGGYNANQLLARIDYELIRNNPKILIGYSDITALQLAIYRKTGLITYSGPFFSTFGMKQMADYTIQGMLAALTNDAPFELEAPDTWSDDKWYLDQEDRTYYPNEGPLAVNEGKAEGRLIGGNLCTLNLLQGTEFMPSLKGAVLFIEDDNETHLMKFDRDLQSILHLPEAKDLKAVLIGRFQKESDITEAALVSLLKNKPELDGIPVLANVSFGHTDPIATLPVGGYAEITAEHGRVDILVYGA
ncbi:S66 family peptidase [Pseudobacillus badius]|uniref:S66 family peptidase n=1 Tax=Bacillus badius TaxID=1455 RepID=UPI0007B05DE7|nr:S66 peptidase family protein [Bacillus badius]KZO00320.1 peptidase S66 [Bacillus badius]OCS86488.1 peptidase S66 [Bacillus badius]OVE52049.1 LD-carboxypeptidase [Bacillus badius]TDW03751.1 muramoyltetrapeptide carboxypeptidase LdcA involved in peptidoglycan recycling [Bacillus badius]GLY09418.1 putative carboxypeptidase YocD [Bacillus badius]